MTLTMENDSQLNTANGSPTRTGLRKRGQVPQLDPQDGLLRPGYTRSIVSMRSEMTLAILDYYIHDAGREETRPLTVDPALQSFDFDLPEKTTPDDDRTTLPSYRSNFFRKALPKLSAPPKRRLGLPYLQQHRRRSSLSICCQGEGYNEQPEEAMPELSFSCRSADSSPISPRNAAGLEQDLSSMTRPRCDSVASNTPTRMSKTLPPTPELHRARQGSLQSSHASSSASQRHEAPSSGSSFDFVRSVRRRPVPLQEAPPSLRLERGGVKRISQTITSRIRRIFSFRRNPKT